MKIAALIARILLGLVFLVFGLNAFLHFIPMPPPPPGPAGNFTGALFVSGYFYPIAVLQIIGALFMLGGRFIPLGLFILCPIIVNIDLFHIFLNPTGYAPAVIVSILVLFLLWSERSRLAPLFRP